MSPMAEAVASSWQGVEAPWILDSRKVSCQQIFYQNTKYGPRHTPFLGLKGKIETLSTRDIVCGKFTTVCRKIETFPQLLPTNHNVARRKLEWI